MVPGVPEDLARVEATLPAGRSDGAADETQHAEIGQDFRFGKSAPRPRRNLHCLTRRHAEQKPGLLERLADGGKRKRPRLGGTRALQMLHQVGFRVGVQRFRDRHEPVGRIYPPAGENEFAWHEFVPLVAFAEQDLGQRPRPVDQDQCRRILRPHVGRREVTLDLVHPLDESVHPLEPVRLHVTHYWVSSISLRPFSVTCCRGSPSTNDVFLMDRDVPLRFGIPATHLRNG